MFRTLKEDLDAVMERDPAARSRAEVFFLYSGFKAVRSHRKANWCYRHNLKFLARWISQRSRKKTGIEIHPGAQIGRGLFIDHGMGVVIGETTQIGDNCTLYQGVTLGGTGKDTGKRHPTLGDNVLIGAGAKVLGPFTVGDNARVAAGAVVLDAVPEGATAVGVPARVVRINGEKVPANPPRHPCDDMDQIHVADPVSMELCRLRGEMERLEKRLQELEEAGPGGGPFVKRPGGYPGKDEKDGTVQHTDPEKRGICAPHPRPGEDVHLRPHGVPLRPHRQPAVLHHGGRAGEVPALRGLPGEPGDEHHRRGAPVLRRGHRRGQDAQGRQAGAQDRAWRSPSSTPTPSLPTARSCNIHNARHRGARHHLHRRTIIHMVARLCWRRATPTRPAATCTLTPPSWSTTTSSATTSGEDLAVGVRDSVEEDPNKRNKTDFVLWFTKSKFEDQELKWDSPWGLGYPGWHIECSAISVKELGEYLDIHCGGIDNAFPHHTNEIAQSEAYLGHPWCKYWFHVLHLNDARGKMSKSKGGFLTVSLLEEKGYDPLVYRLFCLQSHYRKPLTFSFESLDNAAQAYQKLVASALPPCPREGQPDETAAAALSRSSLPPPWATT